MAVLYSEDSTETSSNYNWNAATDNDAGTFVPTASGTPTELVIRLAGIAGTPTGDFYIRNQNTVSGATTYATASNVTLASGSNTIALTGGTTISSGTTYYLWFARETASTVYPQFQYQSTGANLTQYRSTAADSDPTTVWFTGNISFDINGTLSTVKSKGSITLLGVG